ncbi:MAG: serine/threonine-protein kinase [Myxococcota bacterium]
MSEKHCIEPRCPARDLEQSHARFCSKCGRALQIQSQAEDPLVGEVISQRYRVLRVLGRGGMGIVYKVEHLAMGKTMAMKLLHAHVHSRQSAVRRFRQEIKIVSRLSHMNTISVFDCGVTQDGHLFVVMEYLRGSDLEVVLREQTFLEKRRAVYIAQQVCASLAEAHHMQIIHRDIKPANIVLLDQQGTNDFVKVLDFGIAKLVEEQGGVMTEVGLIIGTPYYMAPEQAMGRVVLGPSADIYSLGVVLFEMITGRLPFLGEQTADFIHAHVQREAPAPSDCTDYQEIDEVLNQIVLRCLEKRERDRYPDIVSLQEALQAYLLEFGHPATPVPINISSVKSSVSEKSEPTAMPSHLFGGVSGVPSHSVGEVHPREHIAVSESPADSSAESVATRSDWDRVERVWRRRVWLRTWGVLFLLFLSFLGGAWYFFREAWMGLWIRRGEVYHLREREANNTILEANLIRVGHWIRGELGKRLEISRSDHDWYRFRLLEKHVHHVSLFLKAPKGLDVELGLYRLERTREEGQLRDKPVEIHSVDVSRAGGLERLRQYQLKSGSYYLLVRELLMRDSAPKEFRGLYKVKVQDVKLPPHHEIEPNGRFERATQVSYAAQISGYFDREKDIDFFSMRLPRSRTRHRYRMRFVTCLRCQAGFAVLDDKGTPLRLRQRKRLVGRRANRQMRVDVYFYARDRIWIRIESALSAAMIQQRLRVRQEAFHTYRFRVLRR